ncbi:MAG: ABC transporter substrate-binding protein, partial [Deltaproteobacteria bacterium]|nr:ABC transporter substrate-binding protein [Deltaproteobacteria bacterium]
MKRLGTAVLVLILVCIFVGLGGVTTCLAKAKYDTIRIASFEPRSGTFKMIGDAKTYGVQYNTRLWNEQHGGLLGKKIEVIPYDNQLKPDVAVRLATKAILEEKCNVLFSSTGSHIAKALQGVAEKYKVLFIMGVAEAASLTGEQCNPYSFRIALNTAMHSRAVARYFADKPEIKTFGIICQDYNFGYEAAEDFKKALKEFRPDAKLAVEIYHPIATKDFAPYITKL